jgi:hypothetical protein
MGLDFGRLAPLPVIARLGRLALHSADIPAKGTVRLEVSALHDRSGIISCAACGCQPCAHPSRWPQANARQIGSLRGRASSIISRRGHSWRRNVLRCADTQRGPGARRRLTFARGDRSQRACIASTLGPARHRRVIAGKISGTSGQVAWAASPAGGLAGASSKRWRDAIRMRGARGTSSPDAIALAVDQRDATYAQHGRVDHKSSRILAVFGGGAGNRTRVREASSQPSFTCVAALPKRRGSWIRPTT